MGWATSDGAAHVLSYGYRGSYPPQGWIAGAPWPFHGQPSLVASSSFPSKVSVCALLGSSAFPTVDFSQSIYLLLYQKFVCLIWVPTMIYGHFLVFIRIQDTCKFVEDQGACQVLPIERTCDFFYSDLQIFLSFLLHSFLL